MLHDLTGLTPPAMEPNGVVVVGSGAAGIAVALSLAERGRKVLLVESGAALGRRPGPAVSADVLNEGESTGLPFQGLVAGRRWGFGGTTELWHGQCMRLHPIDLSARDWVPGSGWPLEIAELSSYSAAAERWFDVSGCGYDASRWDEHPTLPPLNWDGSRLEHDFTEYAPRPLVGRTHWRRLRRHPQVLVLVNATLARVETDGAGVCAIHLLDPAGGPHRVAARTVVLAAGGIENARLLQLSDPEGVGIGTGRSLTGRFLQDHPIVRTAEVLAPDYRVLQDRYVALHRGRRKLFPKVRLSAEAQRRHHLLDATAVFDHEWDEPSVTAARSVLGAVRSRRLGTIGSDLGQVLRDPLPVASTFLRRYRSGAATRRAPSHVWLQVWLEQAPDAHSQVVLATSVDRLGLRRPEVRWRLGEMERRTSRMLTAFVAQDLERLGVARIRPQPAMEDDEAWDAAVRDAFHPAGTTRMSAGPATGVVDVNLQVHGVPGMFVVGGSVFPPPDTPTRR